MGKGWDFHFGDISRTLWGEKLGCEVGRHVAKTEWTSTSPLIANPVASSSVNPCKKGNFWWACEHYKSVKDPPDWIRDCSLLKNTKTI